MKKKQTQFHTVESFSQEEKVKRQRIVDIKNKITWGTANFYERNILKIYEKNLKKQSKEGFKKHA